ncbi:MAG: hypothetical protein ACM359_18065 [Bacillota bacterium]
MATPKFYIRGTFPFSAIAKQLAQDEAFLKDTKSILDIDEGTFDTLALTLTKFDSFLDKRTAESLVTTVLGKGEQGTRIAKLIWRLNDMLREPDEPFEKSMQAFRSAMLEPSDASSSENRQKLVKRIETLLLAPGFARQHKAERLADATGAALDELQLICDIRPVFNDDRTAIDGVVPVTTLKLVTIEPDGEAVRVEIHMTEQQLAELASKAESAQRKLKAIKDTLASKSITLAATSGLMAVRSPK